MLQVVLLYAYLENESPNSFQRQCLNDFVLLADYKMNQDLSFSSTPIPCFNQRDSELYQLPLIVLFDDHQHIELFTSVGLHQALHSIGCLDFDHFALFSRFLCGEIILR